MGDRLIPFLYRNKMGKIKKDETAKREKISEDV